MQQSQSEVQLLLQDLARQTPNKCTSPQTERELAALSTEVEHRAQVASVAVAQKNELEVRSQP